MRGRPFVLVGNPDNRRVALFQEALRRQGQPPARVISWRAVARNPAVLADVPNDPAFLRIDSFGEDFELERDFLRRGYAAALAFPTGPRTLAIDAVDRLPDDYGRIWAPRQAHLGFLAVLDDVRRVVREKSNWLVLNEPDDIEEMFDKSATSARFASNGVPVPEPLAPGRLAPNDVDLLRTALVARGVDQVYVKLSCGSSASCLALWRLTPDESLVTTIEVAPEGYFNSLRLRQYRHRARIDEVLGFLLGEGAHVERALNKARLVAGGRPLHFDCRVLVIAGEPTFTVVRMSSTPITNLHLGGRRGDPLALGERLAPGALQAAEASCRTIGQRYRSLHVGVDLMFESDLRGHRVLEANAFGDLLPNLERDGMTVYEWEIRAALGR